MQTTRSLLVFSLLAAVTSALAQVNSQSDGSDGAFSPTGANFIVDLGLASNGAWNTAGGGNGVYDGSKWAVVFKYSSVNIPAGTTVNFTNHPKNPPVVWLVQGNVTINGTLQLDGESPGNLGIRLRPAVPGPGGFRGGAHDVNHSAGFGPGGATLANGINSGVGGSFGSQPTSGPAASKGPIYGNSQILPLIGGSGATPYVYSGGAGGGAILIVASGTITVNGTIQCNGGYGYQNNYASGSGGAIRLISNQLLGTGSLRAMPSNVYGGEGRIRLERLDSIATFGGSVNPAPSSVTLGGPDPTIWPQSTHPTLVVTSVDGVAVPADPASNFAAPDTQIGPADTSIIRLEAANIPTDGTWRVQVRIVPRAGLDTFVNATFVSGNQVASIWEAIIAIPQGGSAVTARAYKL